MSVDMDKGFHKTGYCELITRTVKTDKGKFTIRKFDNQKQRFRIKTTNMSFAEAAAFAFNTKSFKALIKSHKYSGTTIRCFIVEPCEDGDFIDPEKELLWEVN